MHITSKHLLYGFLTACVAVFLLSPDSVHLALGTSPYGRFSYVFAHHGWAHIIANAMAINAIARSRYRLQVTDAMFAFVIAWSVPEPSIPVVGASAFIYAIFGIISWQAARRFRFHFIVFVFILAGFVFARHFANFIHLYAYLFGVVYGYARRLK